MRRSLYLFVVVLALATVLSCGETLPEFKTATWDYGDGTARLGLPPTVRLIGEDSAEEGVSVSYGNVRSVRDANGVLRLLDPTDPESTFATRIKNIDDNAKWFKDVEQWDGEISGNPTNFVRATWLLSDNQESDEFIFEEVELSAFVSVNGQMWRISCYSPSDDGLQQRICEHIVNSLKVE